MHANRRNVVYLENPRQEDELLPAQLIKEDDGVISMRLLQNLMLEPNTQSRHFFHDPEQRFFGFACNILRVESGGENPIVSVIQTGPKERQENRETFRIGIYDDSVTAKISGKYAAEVLDMGYYGIALVATPGSFVIDAWLDVEVCYDQVRTRGRMQVKNRSTLKDGRYRYGMMADTTDMHLVKDMANIVQTLQTIKARRNSRLSNKPLSFKGSTEDECSGEQADKKQSNANEKTVESPDGTKRRHLRKQWTGEATLYVREQLQLRVLDVHTQDLSQGGVCVLSRQYIYEGTEVMFEKPLGDKTFRVCGKVCNVFVNAAGMHRVGIQFTGAPLKHGEKHPYFDAA